MTTASVPKMTYRLLGNSGLKVSVFSYGAWVSFSHQIGVDTAYDIMKTAYTQGVNFFDNAETYAAGEAETIMGEAVQKGIANKVWKRSDLVLSTKLYFGSGGKGPNDTGLSRKHIIEGMHASLERLNLSYVDLVFCHRPCENTPIEETVRAMNYLIDKGYAFYWGTSEWPADSIQKACDICERLGMQKPTMEQPEYSMFQRQKVEKDYLPLYEKHGLGLTTWSPLMSGILTGKYSGMKVPEGSRLNLESYKWLKEKIFSERGWMIEKVDQLKPIADEIGASTTQLALAWCVRNPHVSTVILGATNLDQFAENMQALTFVDKLTDDIMARLDVILTTKPE